MTVKEWLNRGRYLDREIDQLLEDQQNALNLACGTAVSYGGEKGTDKQEKCHRTKIYRLCRLLRQDR